MEWLSEDIPGARVLDLFAGTGALGLEALSRGAVAVDFVENGAEALHALKANRTKLRATRESRLFKKEVFGFLDGVPDLRYDLTFADPPYTSSLAEALVERWQRTPFSIILTVEHSREIILPGKGSRRVHEDTAVTTYRTTAEKED